MTRPRFVLWGLLCLLVASGCVSSSRSQGFSLTPFKKKSATVSTTPKQPLTQMALDALKLKPKKKTNVRIVSPLDWFRGSTDDESQMPADQLTELAEKYRAAVANRVGSGQPQLTGSQPAGFALSSNASSPPQTRNNGANMLLPSRASSPVAPQFSLATATSNANATLPQLAAKQPTIQLQSGQLPAAQPTLGQVPTAQYATAPAGLPSTISPAVPQYVGPQGVPSTIPAPPIASSTQGASYASSANLHSPQTNVVAPATPYPSTNQLSYPTTNQRPLPSLSTTSAFGPTYR